MLNVYDHVADALVILHLLWVVFMVAGILATMAGVLWRRALRAKGWRWVHLIGLVFSASLGAAGEPCPLTTLEYTLRGKSGAVVGVEESFVIRMANRLIFPDLEPMTLSVATIAAGLFVVAVFVWQPPGRESR